MKFVYIFLLIAFNVVANDKVEVRVSPEQPVPGETFRLIFDIETNSDLDPKISFDQGRAEVLGRSNRAVSIESSIINGRVSQKKTISLEYELVADRAGTIIIKDIEVSLGSMVLKAKNKRIVVTKKKGLINRDVFALAIPDKTTAYVGEAVNVDYYIYFRSNLVNTEIREFPKFNKFFKRFFNVKDRVEQVEYNGKIYRRVKKYSVRLYPEKKGKLKIGPMRFSVQFLQRDNQFGGFGFINRYATKNISSDSVPIEVIPIPTENMPKSYTGLVGNHSFNLIQSKVKNIVNDAIELKVEVTGEGLLENLDIPQLYRSDILEDFDTKSDLKILDKESAKKVVEFTYLAKRAGKINPSKFELATFDPETKSFKVHYLDLLGIEIFGGSNQVVNTPKQEQPRPEQRMNNLSKVDVQSSLLAPDFKFESDSGKYLRYINLALAMITLFLLVITIKGLGKKDISRSIRLVNTVKKSNMSYKALSNLFRSFDKNEDIDTIINNLNISEDSKSYFKSCVYNSQAKDYGAKSVDKMTFEKRYFDELSKLMEKRNGNS